MRTLLAIVVFSLFWISCIGQNEPAKATDSDVIAVVLGKKITVAEKDRLNTLIFRPLLEQYAKENKIEVADEELDTFAIKMEEKEKQTLVKTEQEVKSLKTELESKTLDEKERKRKEEQLKVQERFLNIKLESMERTKGMEQMMRLSKRQVGYGFVKAWKINKSLYGKYGGRVIFQQAGPEPLDAYRDFLKEQEKNGSFQIIDKAYEEPFWKYFTNDSMHRFYPKDEGEKFINNPWWMMDMPRDRQP